MWRDRNKISGYVMAEHILEQGELQRIAIVPIYPENGNRYTAAAGVSGKEYRKMGVETIYLEVRESNEIARNFIKIRFEEYGRRPKYYSDPMEDAILMFWDDPDPIHSLPVESEETSSYNDSGKEEETMVCNVCGNKINDKSDFIDIKKEWGYFSNKDTEIHEFKICERCYDRIVKQFEIPPKVTEKSEVLS